MNRRNAINAAIMALMCGTTIGTHYEDMSLVHWVVAVSTAASAVFSLWSARNG